VDAGEFAADVVSLVEFLAAERGLELSVEVGGDPGSLHADPGKLRQILVDLLGSAIKFTERGGVVLEVRSSDADVLFAVRDTGKAAGPRRTGDRF
jgi:signal transduction histidine kinase